MTTPALNPDVAIELTKAMIVDEAKCAADGHDDLKTLCAIRDYGALLSRLERLGWTGDEPASADLEQVADIAVWWVETTESGDSADRSALAAKALTFLYEYAEAA